MFHKSTYFSEYDLREFVSLKLTHHKNLSPCLYPKATVQKVVNAAAPDPGCQPVPFALQPVLPLQKKMSVGDMNCPSFAGCSYTKEEKKVFVY